VKVYPSLADLAEIELRKWNKPDLYYYDVEQVCTWLKDVVKIPDGYEVSNHCINILVVISLI
jgi:hypothetical protein